MASILSRLKNRYPAINFVVTEEFSWEPASSTVYYKPNYPNSDSFLLHEVSHSILGHNEYRSDVGLVRMEREAWQKAKAISQEYDLSIPEDLIEEALDSYRDWLHARSTCPNCQATGLQLKNKHYKCPACSHEWQVNEARNCRLVRYQIKNTP